MNSNDNMMIYEPQGSTCSIQYPTVLHSMRKELGKSSKILLVNTGSGTDHDYYWHSFHLCRGRKHFEY